MNIKNLVNYQKFISVITATCLLVSFVIGPTAASAINNEQITKEYNQIFKEFILPYSYGKITKSHFAGTDRVIINIQDLHCHPKVQKNIANIIETFDKKFGVEKIYLEGAYGDVNTKWIADKTNNNKNIIDQMLDTGRLTGAEYYSALSGKTEIIKGLEEKEPYLNNIKRLGKILQDQEKINLILNSLHDCTDKVKKKYYTKRQYKLEKLFKEYKEGNIPSQKYYTLLSKHIDKLGVDLTKYENILIYITLLELQKDLNYKQITKELQSLISILKQQLPYNAYKSLLENTENFKEIESFYSYIIQLDKTFNFDISSNFKELDKYFRYVELTKKINPVELIKEDELLVQEINTRFSQTGAQQEIVFFTYFEKYLIDYLTTKITPGDYEYYKNNIDKYRQIYNKYVDNRVLSLLDEYISETDKFYNVNLDRNIYFTKNIFKENEFLNQIENPKQSKDDINKIIDNMNQVKKLDIVVTGGFHSQTITEILEKQNVSYIVITPNVTDGIKLAEDTYYELAKEQSKISFQTIAPVIASLSPQLQKILLEKIGKTQKEEIDKIISLSDTERAKIISELAAAKLLESDDVGAVEEKLQEIVEAIVGDYNGQITPDIISQIKDLQKLLKDTKKLKKVIDLLSEKSSAKQSIEILVDMYETLYTRLEPVLNFVESESEQNKKDNIQSKEIQEKQTQSKGKKSVIVPSVKIKGKARDLTKKEEERLKKFLSRTKVRIKNSTLEITEENDKNLIIEIQGIFNNLLDSMVSLGKISEEEKKDYELIVYLSDDIDAFTVSGSKTVFISTGMLYSFSEYLTGTNISGTSLVQYANKQTKELGKDHIAAILAHELEHTTQDQKVYDVISEKGDQKKDEYDSDIQAIFILDNAGYNPICVQEVMEFLVFLEEKEKYNSFSLLLDAHPDAENRLTKINTFLSDRNIFLRSTTNPVTELKNSIPFYGKGNLRSDIIREMGYAERGSVPRDSNGFVKDMLKKYGNKIKLYTILETFNFVKRYVNVDDVLNYINDNQYPFFNDKIKQFSDEQKRVIIRLMNSFKGHYPSNKELYSLCPDIDELKEIFDFIIEPENYFYFFDKISFLNISYLVAALHNKGKLSEKDYDKIKKFLSLNEDTSYDNATFFISIDEDTIDFYVDKFDLFDNSKKYDLYRNIFPKENNFSEKQKTKLRRFFLTPYLGGIGGYHLVGGYEFFELLYPETSLEKYKNSITEERKQEILIEEEQKTLKLYNKKSMYDIYVQSKVEFAEKKYKEQFGSKQNLDIYERDEWDAKYKKWLTENKDALFEEWLKAKKEEMFSNACLKEYINLMSERYEKELFSNFSTLEEKLEFLFPDVIIEKNPTANSYRYYNEDVPRILKTEIENVKSKEALFDIVNNVIKFFDNKKSIKKKEINNIIYNILLNINKQILNEFTIEDIQNLFEISISNNLFSVTEICTIAFMFKRKAPNSLLDFDKIRLLLEDDKSAASDFVQNVIDKEQLDFLFNLCSKNNVDLLYILPKSVYRQIVDTFYEDLSLEDRYKYSMYEANRDVFQRIKNKEDFKEIPIEHLKRFLTIHIPLYKTSYMNPEVGGFGRKTSLALKIWQNKLNQYKEKFGKSFYDVKTIEEFTEKIKELEDVFYPWGAEKASNKDGVFSNEVNILWSNLLHNMCGFGLEMKSSAFLDIHNEELLNIWCELTPNEDFIPTAQQTNELLDAFALLKNYLPKDQIIVYAKILYEMIKRNKDLSVFESVENNLELLDFLFEDFSEGKDDYIDEILEKYDIDFDSYIKCFNRMTVQSYKDDTKDTSSNFLYKEVAIALSKNEIDIKDKIKFVAWLISDNQEKPKFLREISVQNSNEMDGKFELLGEAAKVDSIRNIFLTMTKSERAEYIRQWITDILKKGIDDEDYENLKNSLADAYFEPIRNKDNEKIVDALKESFKIIFDSLSSYEKRSTIERQILFISDLTDALISISKSNFSPEEKEARQIGRFIVAMGSASGVAVVKMLQILSNNKAFEGLGKKGAIINEEISKVRSSNEQLSKRVVFQQLEDLGILDEVESVGKCLGSASIGITYLINMKDGSKKIIKIKRPSVLKNYEQDLYIAGKLILYFKTANILPKSNKNMIPTIKFLKQVFDTELNFEDEVNNLLKAKSLLSGSTVKTPDIVGNYNSDSFIQSLAPGQSLDKAKFNYSEQEQSEIYSKILLEFFKEVFKDGFFHADLHEGNIFVDSDKNITFIDWGACGNVENSKKDDLKSIFLSLVLSDSNSFMENLKEYDIGLYDKIKVKSVEIENILKSKNSLEDKLGKIFSILNQTDMSQNQDFLMFIQAISKIAKYIDNLSVRDKILLLLDDAIVYDLLQNKKILSNIENILQNSVPKEYHILINIVIKKLNNSDIKDLQNIISEIKKFVIYPDKESLESLINNIVRFFNLPKVVSNLILLKRNKILNLLNFSSVQQKQIKTNKNIIKSFFKAIKTIIFNKSKKARTKFDRYGDPIIILIERNNNRYSLVFKPSTNSIYIQSINEDAFSDTTSQYTNTESIEDFLGIEFKISKHKLVVQSKDLDTNISILKHKSINEIISSLKTKPLNKPEEREIELLKKDTGCNDVKYIYLDQDSDFNKKEIKDAIENHKLIVLYPFSNIYDIDIEDALSDEQIIYALFFKISLCFREMADVLVSREDFPLLKSTDFKGMEYILLELVRNAFVHGNLADSSKPIYIDCSKEKFTVYNKYNDTEMTSEKKLSFAAMTKLSGTHESAQIIQEFADEKLIEITPQQKRIRQIGPNEDDNYYVVNVERIKPKSEFGYGFRSFDDDDDNPYKIEQEDPFEDEDEDFSPFMSDEPNEQLQLLSTQKKLDEIGQEKSIQNFKYTIPGVALGTIIEIFSFWEPNFIRNHKFDPSIKTKMTAVVWIIRALSIGIGLGTGAILAVTAFSPFFAFFGIPALFLTEIVLHFIWNINNIPEILELKESINPIDVEQEVINTGLSQDFIDMVNQNSADKGFISLYDAYRMGRQKNKVRRTLKGKEKIIKNNGYALGLTNYYLGDGKLFEPVWGISDSENGMNLCTYSDGYYEFQQDGTRIRTNKQYLEKIFKDCENNNKEVYFFLPPNINSFNAQNMQKAQQEYMKEHPELQQSVSGLGTYQPGITKEEINWLKANPQYMKYVHFVVGSYTFLDENIDKTIFQKYFNINNISKTFASILSAPRKYMKAGHNLILQMKQTQAEINYDKRDVVTVLLITKEDGTQYSVRLALKRITEDDKTKQDYIKTGVSDRKMFVYLSSINDDAFSIATSKYTTIEYIERITGVKIEVSKNTIVAKSDDPKTQITFVKNREISKNVSSLTPEQIPAIEQQEQSDVENIAKAEVTEIIYLDESSQEIERKFKHAIENNSLIVIYPFSTTYNIDSLTDEQLYSLYFNIQDKFFELQEMLDKYLPGIDDNRSMAYILKEFIKNAFVHGNLSNPSIPIYIKFIKNGFTVINEAEVIKDEQIRLKRLNLSAAATLTGAHRGLQIIRAYEEAGLINLDQEIKTKEIVDENGEKKKVSYYIVTAVRSFENNEIRAEINFNSLIERVFEIIPLIEKTNNKYPNDRAKSMTEAEEILTQTFTPEELEIIDLLASTIFDSIKYVNSTRNTSAVEFVNIIYSLQNGLFNDNLLITEGDLKQHILNMLKHYVEISKQKKGEENILVKTVENNEDILDDMANFLCNIIVKNNLIQKAKQKREQRRKNISKFIEGVRKNDTAYSAIMICSANENRSAIWHIMFEDFLKRTKRTMTKVFSAGVFYDISQEVIRQTGKARVLRDDYHETLSFDDRYKGIDESIKSDFRSTYIKYLKVPKGTQQVFIVAGEQHRAQLIKLGYDPSWIFLMSEFYSDDFKTDFKQTHESLGKEMEENNIFSMSEFPDPFEEQILRQDLPELVKSLVEYVFKTRDDIIKENLPERFVKFTDDFNQFEHMEDLPYFASDGGYEEKRQREKREATRELYEDEILDLVREKHQFEFRANTKYLYILQNRNNKDVMLDIVLSEDSDLKFKLFALMYLVGMRRNMTQEELNSMAVAKDKMITELKKQIETNSFNVLNNFDLRAYMMGIYLMLQDDSLNKPIPEIISNAFIINKGDKILADSHGYFGVVDLFTIIHELAHVVVLKPDFYNDLARETIGELVSYITPNMFLSIVKLSLKAYSKLQTGYYTIHQTNGLIDYVKMGKKLHVLYNLFSEKTADFNLKQKEHSAPIAFLELLFNAHMKIGKTVYWSDLFETIKMMGNKPLNQSSMFSEILNEYTKILVSKGKLSKQEVYDLIKEIEKMQMWTLLTYDIVQNIKVNDPDTYNKILGNKENKAFEEQILSNPANTKEYINTISNIIKSKEQLSRNDILTLLIIDVISNIDYEQLINNFDGVIEGIMNAVRIAAQIFDMQKEIYSLSEYEQIKNYVTDNYNITQNSNISIIGNIFDFIANSLDKLFFAKLLLNQVFGTKNLSNILKDKKLLIVTSKQQEENLQQVLKNNNVEDIKIVTMEIKTEPVSDIRSDMVLDVQRGIKVKYDTKENKLIVYSKQGIDISTEDIKELIMQEYFAERSEDIIDKDVIAFADATDTTFDDITNRLKTSYTASVTMPNKEQRFDLSSKPISNIITSCKQEFSATGIKTFTINREQAEKFVSEIKSLQEEGFRFIISCKSDNILDITIYDGLVIDATKITDINQAMKFMDSIKKKVLIQGIAKQISVEFNDDIYIQFDNLKRNIIDKYGIMPLIDANSQSINLKNIGKYEVKNVTENNIDNLLRNNSVIGLVIDNARVLIGKKSIIKQLFSKEHKYNKGYNASLSSKFDYICYDVSALAELLNIDINNEKDLNKLKNLDLSKLSLSSDSLTYLEYLQKKANYEEMAGFIKGIVMNTARVQIIKELKEKGIELDVDKFAKESNGKYQKAFLTVAVQLMIEDIDITKLLETDFIDSDMTTKQYLDSVYEKVNINIEDILKQNEYKIQRTENTAKTIEDFKNYVVLLDNLKIVKETTANFDMSIKAVRNMLAAA